MRFDPLAISGSLATDASASEPLPANDNSFRVFLGGRIDQVSDTFGDILAHTYDTAGRLTATATTVAGAPAALTTTYTLDANGNRTELLWPDGYYVGYCFDSMNRMTAAMANSTSSGCATNVLATYTYDPYSRRTNLAYGASASMGYAYTPANDLTSLTLNMTGTGNDNAWTLGYSNAHQLASEAASIANYKWEPACATSPCTDSYATVNTLNQYPSMTPSGGTAQTQSHDGNGNLTGDGTLTYTYDPENRLMTACNNSTCTGTMSAAYAYDPLGRREEKSGTGVTAAVFLQDGDDEIAEYNTSGVVQRRFVPGPTVDDAIAMVPASGTTELFYTDHHGSVVATSDSSGNLIEGSFVYDSYGNCYLGTAQATSCTQPTGSEPFKFTGQYYDAETGCYYYRARMYCADILHGGRFLQTDPVGYKDDLNLYTYVGNDPTNGLDSTGLDNTNNGCGSGNTGSHIPGSSGSSTGGSAGFCEGGAAYAASSGGSTAKFIGTSSSGRLYIEYFDKKGDFQAIESFDEGKVEDAVGPFDFIAGPGEAAAEAGEIGIVSVYRAISAEGEVTYVGITNSMERRAAQQFAQKGIENEGFEGLSNFSRADAKAVEQVLIEFHGLGKNGGTLLNKINSIAKTNPIYASSMARGVELLLRANYPGF